MRTSRFRSPALFILVTFIVTGVIVTDVLLWRSTRKQLYRDATNELAAVSDLKRQHLEFWVHDRQQSVRAAVPIVQRALRGERVDPQAASSLRLLMQSDEWNDIAVMTGRGEKLWSASGKDTDPSALMAALAAEALRTQEVAISGVHRDSGKLSIDMVVHVRGDVFVLAALDASASYMQVTERWPTMRDSAHAELLHVRGDSVEYLTRPHGNAALPGQIVPKWSAGSAIVAALAGNAQPLEGLDERGHQVIAVARRVAGTPWILVAMMERDAVFRPLRTNYLFTLLSVALLAVIGVLAALLLLLHRREQTIAENAEWFQRLFDASPFAIDASIDDRLVRVNPAFAHLFGYDRPEELIGHSPFATVAPKAREDVHDLRGADLEKGAIIETTGRRRDGSEFPMQVRIASLRHGGASGRIAFVEDISERKRAAQTLERSRDFYMRLLDDLPNPVWRGDAGLCTYVNRAWIEFTGRPFEEHLGRGWVANIHPEDRVQMEKEAEAVASRQPFSVEYRVLHHSGEYRWIVDHGMPFVDVDGSYGGYLGTCYDIHELRTAQERFRSLVEHAADLITIIDANGTIVYQNPRVEAVLGYRADEMIGTAAEAFIHPEDNEDLYDRVRRTPNGVPFRVRHKDGTYRYMESMVTRMPGAERQVVITSRDITERRSLEETATRNERMNALGRVAANVAHEFNNVLQSITPFAAAIERVGVGQPGILDAAGQIHRAVRRGREITQEILRFSRPEPPERRPLDVHAWLADVSETITAYAGTSIDVRLELEDAPLSVMADATQLHQALTNLAVNACHAMPKGGVLTIHAARDAGAAGEGVTISVSDSGSGIAPDVLPHIFEPMFTTKRSRGTGLGLPITQQIVVRHGGTITVETDLGAGSTFHIHLPSSAEEKVAEETAPPRPTALVVEDDPIVAMAIEALLDLDGFDVINVATASRAIDWATRRRPDLAVLDVGLPDMSGTELFRRLRNIHEDLPTVFSTGHAEREARAAAAGMLNVACLVKPYDYESLSRAVREVVSG